MSGRERSGRGGRLGPGRWLTVLAVVSVLVHLFGLYRPTGPPTPSWFPQFDKVEHLVGFGAPVCLILLAVSYRRVPRPDRLPARPAALVVAVFALHAVVSELVQHFCYVHRTGDPRDALADGVGVALGWGVAVLVLRRGGSPSAPRATAAGEPR